MVAQHAHMQLWLCLTKCRKLPPLLSRTAVRAPANTTPGTAAEPEMTVAAAVQPRAAIGEVLDSMLAAAGLGGVFELTAPAAALPSRVHTFCKHMLQQPAAAIMPRLAGVWDSIELPALPAFELPPALASFELPSLPDLPPFAAALPSVASLPSQPSLPSLPELPSLAQLLAPLANLASTGSSDGAGDKVVVVAAHSEPGAPVQWEQVSISSSSSSGGDADADADDGAAAAASGSGSSSFDDMLGFIQEQLSDSRAHSRKMRW
jgi:hypothetical protein